MLRQFKLNSINNGHVPQVKVYLPYHMFQTRFPWSKVHTEICYTITCRAAGSPWEQPFSSASKPRERGFEPLALLQRQGDSGPAGAEGSIMELPPAFGWCIENLEQVPGVVTKPQKEHLPESSSPCQKPLSRELYQNPQCWERELLPRLQRRHSVLPEQLLRLRG